MRIGHRFFVRTLQGAVAAAALAAAVATAQANWLSRLAREAAEVGEVGGKAARLGLGALERAAAFVAKLPPPSRGVALAAHATPEGHWKFVNRSGEIFTAANSEELRRAVGVLAPRAEADGKLALYLSEESVFRERALLKDLPPDADLHTVLADEAYPLLRSSGAPDRLFAAVRPNISVEIGDRHLFDEAAFRLARPLNRSSVRMLALEPGGPRTLSSVPALDRETGAALVDAVDPATLGAALKKVRGQTVLVTGRVDGDALAFMPASGTEQKLRLSELLRAAEAADVNVVVLKGSVVRQPGGRNWLYQRVEVASLDDALQRATFADFLAALAGNGGDLVVTAAPGPSGRVVLRAIPSGAESSPIADTISEWMSEITGNVAVQAVEIYARDQARETELDLRLIPGIPSTVQFTYLAGLILGVLGFPVSRRWWARLWPTERREEYRGVAGFMAARAVRFLAFALLFLPLVGAPAFVWSIVLQLAAVLMAPFRVIAWLRDRLLPRAT